VLVDTNGTEDYGRQYQSQDNRSIREGYLAQYRSTQIVAGTAYITAILLREKTNEQRAIHTSFLGDRIVSGLIFVGYLEQFLHHRLKKSFIPHRQHRLFITKTNHSKLFRK